MAKIENKFRKKVKEMTVHNITIIYGVPIVKFSHVNILLGYRKKDFKNLNDEKMDKLLQKRFEESGEHPEKINIGGVNFYMYRMAHDQYENLWGKKDSGDYGVGFFLSPINKIHSDNPSFGLPSLSLENMKEYDEDYRNILRKIKPSEVKASLLEILMSPDLHFVQDNCACCT